MARPFRRRVLLQGVAATTVVACSSSRSKSGPPAVADGGSGQLAGLALLEDMQAVLKGAANFLPGAAERVVAGKDPEKIFLFVRDNVTTVPASATDVGGPEQVLWGARGALRSGAGTTRDKAELLADLYRQAGFQASIVQGLAADGPAVVDRVLRDARTVRPPPFSLPAEALDRWRRSTGTKPTTVTGPLVTDADAKALGARLVGALPADGAADPAFDVRPPLAPLLPLVAVTVSGKVRYANPALAGLPFGTSGVEGEPQPAAPREAPGPAKLSLLLGTTTDTDGPRVVATLDVAQEDLLGRSAYLLFAPAMSPTDLLRTRPRDVRAFVPVLAVRGLGLDKKDEGRLTAAGDPFTLEGQVMQVSAAGEVKVDGRAVDAEPTPPDVLARVAKLDAVADASRFPDIEIALAALDSQGKQVTGLTASAFALTDGGDARAALLLENKVVAPRILFLVDKSDSIPPEFRGDGLRSLVTDLARRVQTVAADAQFRALAVGGRVEDTQWTKDPAAVAKAAFDAAASGSDLWAALGAAASLGPTAVVFITDGDPEFDPSDADLAALGPLGPTVLIAVGPQSARAESTLARMARLTGGDVVRASDTAQATSAVGAILEGYNRRFYRMRYRAPAAAQGRREVAVALRGRDVTGKTGYEAPAAADRRVPRRLSGLHLRVELPGRPALTRLVAGVFPFEKAGPADIDAVEAALFGITEIRFEGEAPTPAVVLTEIVSELLALEPAVRALASKDLDKMIEGFANRPLPSQILLRALHAPVSIDGAPATFASGLRAVAVSVLPRWKQATLIRADILPLGPHHTPAEARTALARTLDATARLALVEKALFPRSATADLDGKKLVPLSPASTRLLSEAEQARLDYLVDQYGRDNMFLVPDGGKPLAFYFVDRRTGAALPVGDTGAGCGESNAGDPGLDALNNGLSAISSVAGAFGGMGFAAGLIVGVYVGLYQKLIAATIIIGGGTLGVDRDPTDFSDVAQNFGLSLLGGANTLATMASSGAIRSAGRALDAFGGLVDATQSAYNAACSLGG